MMTIINNIYYPYVFERNEFLGKSVATIDVSYSDRRIISIYDSSTAREHKFDEEHSVFFVNRFIQNSLQTIPTWNLLHGAALVVNGKTVLFLGKSESGKTTLTAYLMFVMRQTYISEDILIINYERNELTPFPRSLNLRYGTQELLRDVYSFEIPNVSHERLGSYDRLICKPGNVMNDVSQIDCIVLLQRGKPTTYCTFELIEKNKIDILLNSCFIPTNILDNFKSSILLAEKNTLYQARYGDLNSFYEKLSELIQ